MVVPPAPAFASVVDELPPLAPFAQDLVETGKRIDRGLVSLRGAARAKVAVIVPRQRIQLVVNEDGLPPGLVDDEEIAALIEKGDLFRQVVDELLHRVCRSKRRTGDGRLRNFQMPPFREMRSVRLLEVKRKSRPQVHAHPPVQ